MAHTTATSNQPASQRDDGTLPRFTQNPRHHALMRQNAADEERRAYLDYNVQSLDPPPLAWVSRCVPCLQALLRCDDVEPCTHEQVWVEVPGVFDLPNRLGVMDWRWEVPELDVYDQPTPDGGPCSSLTRTYATRNPKGDTFETRFFLPPPRATLEDLRRHPATYRYPDPLHDAVRALAATYGLNSHDVEDMEQEAALRLCRRWASFRGDLDDFEAVALTHVKQASIDWLRRGNHSHELKQWRAWLAHYENRAGISLLDDNERYRIFDAKGARRWYLDPEVKAKILPPEYVHESLSWEDGSDRVDLGSVSDTHRDPVPFIERLADLGWSPRQQRVAVLTALDYTQEEIATSLGVTKRTVARDLQTVRDATFPDFETSSLAGLSPGDDGTRDGATDTAGPQP